VIEFFIFTFLGSLFGWGLGTISVLDYFCNPDDVLMEFQTEAEHQSRDDRLHEIFK